MEIELSDEQLVVKKYLERAGCAVAQNVNRDGILVFRPIGASTNGGCVFQNGNVYIHNEHTEPFEDKVTTYYTILCRICGEKGAKQYVKHLKRYEKEQEEGQKLKYRVTLDETESPCPTTLAIVKNANIKRSTTESISTAIACGELKTIETTKVWDWIRKPPSWWLSMKNQLDNCDDAEDYETLKTNLKRYNTPCLTNMLGIYPTIGWLDVDGKENASDVVAKLKTTLKGDNRVLALFQSLSGSGFAIGIGIVASDARGYEMAMNYAKCEFERDYPGLKIDKTCVRSKQLRALSHDSGLFVNERSRFYRSITTMIPQGLQDEIQGSMDRVDRMTRPSEKPKAGDYSDTLLEELASIVRALEIEITEDKWTGKRCYKLKGVAKKDVNSLYLSVKDFALQKNGNRFGLSKQEIIDYMLAECVDERDTVMNRIFTTMWDGADRWDKLKGALHLDEFGLKAFQMWMRQGAGLLYNTGEADDLQRNFMLILFSREQSIGKSDLARRLSCGTNSFTQKGLDMKNKDTISDLYSHWIHEFGELGTTFRKKDLNDLKNYVTNVSVTIRRPYDRDCTTLPVRTSIIGTTNDDQLFTDDTGNRRYIVIDCKWSRKDWGAIDSIDFKQLWLQAKWEYLQEKENQDRKYPYTMDAEFQKENDRRCKDKIVKPREMYWVTDMFSHYDPNDFAMYQLAGNKICISMSSLLKRAEENRVSINEMLLSKSLRHFGFESISTKTDTKFFIDKDAFDLIISESKEISEDPEFTFTQPVSGTSFVPSKMNIKL